MHTWTDSRCTDTVLDARYNLIKAATTNQAMAAICKSPGLLSNKSLEPPFHSWDAFNNLLLAAWITSILLSIIGTCLLLHLIQAKTKTMTVNTRVNITLIDRSSQTEPPKPINRAPTPTIWITPKGKCYHRDGECRTIYASVRESRRPCSICCPSHSIVNTVSHVS